MPEAGAVGALPLRLEGRLVEERLLGFSEAREALARFAYDEVSPARELLLSSFQRMVEAKIIEEPLIAFITCWLTQRRGQYR